MSPIVYVILGMLGLLGIQTFRLSRRTKQLGEARVETFKSGIAATTTQRAAKDAQLEKESKDAISKFEKSSADYESSLDAERPWRPSGD